MSTTTTNATTIEVFADIVCPFAYVGLQRLAQTRDERGRDDVHLHVRAYPLELVNGEPMGGDAVAQKAEALRRQVNPALFNGFDGSNFPTTTLPGLALTNAAYRRDPALGEQLALRVRHLTFEDNVDTGDPGVLAELADEFGLGEPSPADIASLELDLAEARERGVIGSPHFFTPDGDMFCPTLDIRKVDGELDISVDYQRFEELLTSIFG